MIDFYLEAPLSEEIINKVEDQMEYLEDDFMSGVILSFSIADDYERMWLILYLFDDTHIDDFVNRMPLAPYYDYDYKRLANHNAAQMLPSLSLN